MKGGALANCVQILGNIGNADAGRSYCQVCVPVSGWLGTPMRGGAIAIFVYPSVILETPAKGGVIANFVYPLGKIGNADEGRICRKFCVPSRYEWERR